MMKIAVLLALVFSTQAVAALACGTSTSTMQYVIGETAASVYVLTLDIHGGDELPTDTLKVDLAELGRKDFKLLRQVWHLEGKGAAELTPSDVLNHADAAVKKEGARPVHQIHFVPAIKGRQKRSCGYLRADSRVLDTLPGGSTALRSSTERFLRKENRREWLHTTVYRSAFGSNFRVAAYYVGPGPEGALACSVTDEVYWDELDKGRPTQHQIEHGSVVSLLWAEQKSTYRFQIPADAVLRQAKD